MSLDTIREAAENDLLFFIKLLYPNRVLGKVHEDIIRFWTNPDAKDHQLVLIPRDHQKSWLMAMRVAWEITKNPCITVLYNSATAYLCQRQLSIIKSALESKKFQKYWPDHINPDPGKRMLWNKDEILLDHPDRAKSSIKEPTVLAAGLTTNITGLHFDVLVLDDIVVVDNAYTEEGRKQVELRYSLLASIETTDSKEWTVGTRYHPNDIYSKMLDMKYEVLDKKGNVLSEETVYEVFQGEVEDQGDGNGEFLWPRTIGPDGRYYGFDQQILARKKAQYIDKTQFFCFLPTTKVYTDSYIKNIEDLKIGDTFKNNKVINTFNRDIDEEICKVSVYGIPERVYVTKGHEFPIRTKTYKKDYGISVKKIGDCIDKKVTERNYLIHEFDTSIVDNKFDNDDWWLIGHYLAEGYKWKKYICLCTRNPEEKRIHSKLENILFSKNIHFWTHVTKNNTKVWYIDYPELFSYLSQFGYYSYGKHLNIDSKIMPLDKQRSLLDGYWKGDGFTLNNQDGFGITSISLRLLEDFKDILLRLGEIPYIVKLYEEGRITFGYKSKECFSLRWYGKKKSRNFIEDNKYYQLIQKIELENYSGSVYTCEVENSHEYNVYGLTCKNSQYYNNPNASENARINPDRFQYYNKESLKCREGDWYINGRFLKTFAAIDFAFSRNKKADYTCLCVIGVDHNYNIYILELDRFQTDEISKYYDSIFKAFSKWGFRKINAEVTVAQQSIVRELKERLRKNGVIGLKVEEYRPSRQDGHKWERIASTLEPLYDSNSVYHYKGGNCELLEQELIMNHPPHDDLKDALSCAVMISSAPIKDLNDKVVTLPFKYNKRFGGING